MRERKLGATGIQVSELSLGTWGISGDAYGAAPDGEAKRVIERARLMGINLFETADSYAAGNLESLLGEVLKDSKATVVTKWGTDLEMNPAQKRFEPEYLKRCAEASKKQIGSEVRLIALLHNPSSDAIKKGEATETMRELQKDGVIESWGVSAGDHEVAQAALEEKAPILSLSYNILQVQPLRALESEIKKQETGLLAHSVLFYGLLTGRWAPNKTFRVLDHRSERWPTGVGPRIRHLDAVRPLVSGEVSTMRSAAVRFVLSNPLITSAVLGARTSSQLDQLVRECRGEPPYISEAKLSALESRLLQLELPR